MKIKKDKQWDAIKQKNEYIPDIATTESGKLPVTSKEIHDNVVKSGMLCQYIVEEFYRIDAVFSHKEYRSYLAYRLPR